MYYKRITKTLADNGKLIPYDDNAHSYINENEDVDYYLSVFKYNEEQFKSFNSSGTIKGITEVVTDKLWFDFDSENEPELAKDDALTLCKRLIELGIDSKSLIITFSGNKGFGVELFIKEQLNPKQVKQIAFALAHDLEHFDRKMYNASRILRIENTKHNKSGLYKILIPYSQFKDLRLDEIQSMATKKVDNFDEFTWDEIDLPEQIASFKSENKNNEKIASVTQLMPVKGLDWKIKPKFLTNCRWALQNGCFKDGYRSHALLCLAATYKNLGFDIEHVYRLLKGVAELQGKRSNTDRFPDSEIWNNIVTQVYKRDWNNGQYNCKDDNDNFLHDYCKGLGIHKCKQDNEKALIDICEASDTFSKFATDIDSNRMTTGIECLDQNVLISTSMLVGLLAAPSAGKTQTTFDVLNNCSKNGIPNMFFSMDMGLPLVYTRLVQKHTRAARDDVFQIYKSNPELKAKYDSLLAKEYCKTKFCFRGGLTVEDIREAIIAQQDKTGEKVKFVAVDYLECISGPFSDSTANTALVAQKLKDIANELDVCVWLLLQTQKSSGDPSEPLLSMRNVKGASAIEQACSVIITLSRPGFSPKNSKENDRFISISTVKDRMGQLMTRDLAWDGLTGNIRATTAAEDVDLQEIRDAKIKAKTEQQTSGIGWT